MVSLDLLWFIVAFVVWALVHSLTAASSFKVWVREQVGARAYEGWYRLFYNLLAAASFLPTLYLLWTRLPAQILWQVPAPFSYLFIAVQGVGLLGLLISLLQTDVLRFVGLSQAIRYLQGAATPAPPPRFVATGMYRLVRHPLYFFSMLVLWFTPVMPLSGFIFNLLATIYFYVGALHEERRLEELFGDLYRRYQLEVPAFIPFLR